MSHNSRRVSDILAAERSGHRTGSAVSEGYGNMAAGPSSSAKFKRGGAVAAMQKAPMLGGPIATKHSEPDGDEVGGAPSAPRMDRRPRRASGGRIDETSFPESSPSPGPAPGSRSPNPTGKRGNTTVNIVVAPQSQPPLPVPSPMGGMPPMPSPPPRPPMPMPSMAGPPVPGMSPTPGAPPMPGGPPLPMRATGGRVGSGTAAARLARQKGC